MRNSIELVVESAGSSESWETLTPRITALKKYMLSRNRWKCLLYEW